MDISNTIGVIYILSKHEGQSDWRIECVDTGIITPSYRPTNYPNYRYMQHRLFFNKSERLEAEYHLDMLRKNYLTTEFKLGTGTVTTSMTVIKD